MEKKALCLIFAFLLSIESFAAIVSDYDGSSFVTKAEFEAMKSDFASQVENYNASIDGKIDGAIASYLAGINLEKKEVLENMYSKCNPTWMRNKRFNQSHKGLKATVFISFTEGVFSGNWLDYNFEGTATGWYVNKSLIKNETDQEILYRVQKKDIGGFKDQWALQDLINSDYSITVGGGAAGTRGGGIGSRTRLLYPDYTLVERPATQKYFGTWYSDLPIAVWEVDTTSQTKTSKVGYIGGTTGSGETVAATAIAKDIKQDDESLTYLAGGQMANDTMYCLNIASVSEIGDSFLKVKTNAGGTRQFAWMSEEATPSWRQHLNFNGGYYDDTEIAQEYYGNIEARVYRHVIQEIQSTDLLHESITQNLNKKVYYYSGCPMFTATRNGKVSFKIKFTHDNAGTTIFAFDNKEFGNAANPQSAGAIEGCNITSFSANNNDVISVSFNVKKDTTYWIKAEPQGTGYASIEFVGDIVQVEE